ncbi:saccharopine dehydrogenase family protein [Allohahella sp. A8]|uniref:saccharopine dehydrogenase family protein n=1 Tax=Allohahella sp. A8 TaxID=3141461 RepID=UPI003A7FDEC1
MTTKKNGPTTKKASKPAAPAPKTAGKAPKAQETSPQYDLIIFGATSFVGELVAEYLLETYGVGRELKWAAAGRSRNKLRDMRSKLGPAAANLPLIIADANDSASLANMCAQTKVVLTTVGPYALYGEPLVKVCAKTGTDYCDLAGEVQWIKQMIDRYEQDARASGARIVHCCGFDSIPSDLGVHFLQQTAMERFGEPCNHVSMRVKGAKGEFSGGTVASLMNVIKEAKNDPELRKQLSDPYLICPDSHHPDTRQPDANTPRYDADFRSWTAPFIMAAINTRVVHRSNGLKQAEYGKDFTYSEATLTGRGVKGRLAAYAVTGATAAFMVGSAIKPTRWAIETFLVPKPGEGPDQASRNAGYFDLRFKGKTKGGAKISIKVTGERDPGYGCTARMMSQAAICLAQDVSKLKGGFWTPSTAMGTPLIERLTKRAGMTFEELDA